MRHQNLCIHSSPISLSVCKGCKGEVMVFSDEASYGQLPS